MCACSLEGGKTLLNASGALIHHRTHRVKLCVSLVRGRQSGVQKSNE